MEHFGAEPAPCRQDSAQPVTSFDVKAEAGAERSVAHGGKRNAPRYEAVEKVKGAPPDHCAENHFGDGPHQGYSRTADAFLAHGASAPFSTCGRSTEMTPWLIRVIVAQGHEISLLSWRWKPHAGLKNNTERQFLARDRKSISDIAGVPPDGGHRRSATSVQTHNWLIEHHGFTHDCNAHDGDATCEAGPHVGLPRAPDPNEVRFPSVVGFIETHNFSDDVIAAFDRLCLVCASAVRHLSVGALLRITGRPARISGQETALWHIVWMPHDWIAPRHDSARVWSEPHGAAS